MESDIAIATKKLVFVQRPIVPPVHIVCEINIGLHSENVMHRRLTRESVALFSPICCGKTIEELYVYRRSNQPVRLHSFLRRVLLKQDVLVSIPKNLLPTVLSE